MALLDSMFKLFSEHGVYGGMVTKKNRCVRIEHKDEFWLDILPACRDDHNGGTCIQVPDRDLRRWKPSNPIGYADWFKAAGRRIIVKFSDSRKELVIAEATVEPLPTLQATEEKTMLQLVVQLLKRWRDIHYANCEYPPISIVLTTLAADLYTGEQSISRALLEVLEGIVGRLDAAHAQGRRLAVPNPVHLEEDFSERWDSCPKAYLAFNDGIRKFADAWREVCSTQVRSSDYKRGERRRSRTLALRSGEPAQVIHLPAGTKIWLAAGVTDMRRGFDGLSAQVQTVLQQQPFSGHVFLFRGRRGDIVKCLWFDGDGLCLFAKRLEKGHFIWPQATEGTVCLSRAQLSMLLEGIDWRRPQRTWTPQIAV